MSLCGISMIHRPRHLHIIRDLLGDFEKWLARCMGKETDPASAILTLSALISLEQLAASECTMELPSPTWNHLDHFFDLVRTGTSIGGQLSTYWQMGCAILRVTCQADFGVIHPIIRRLPPWSICFGLYMEYWKARLVDRMGYEDLLVMFHDRLAKGLREMLIIAEKRGTRAHGCGCNE